MSQYRGRCYYTSYSQRPNHTNSFGRKTEQSYQHHSNNKNYWRKKSTNKSSNDTKHNEKQVYNNHGWIEGWSLEQEFMKQSLNINIKPEHKKYLKKREMPNDYPRETYRRRRGEDKQHILHWGQRKLLLAEMEFFNSHLKNVKTGNDGYKLIVYAGAATGKHIPLLIEFYDNIIMHLYDPNPFCNAVKHVDRIAVYQQYFTDEIAIKYSNLKRDILFMSDIRTANTTIQNSMQIEQSIKEDNNLQTKWTKILAANGNLVGSMLKFRLAYPHLMNQKYDKIGLDGIIKFGVYAPVTSTETRLHVNIDKQSRQIKSKIYNCKVYEEQLFWFNVNARQSFIDNSKYYSPEIGSINSYDCWAECLILEQYLTVHKRIKNVHKKHVICIVNKITNFISAKRCLLTKPCDPHQQKIDLCNKNANGHGLVGYEGMSYIDPQKTKILHKEMLFAFEEYGIDYWTLPVINPMLKIKRIEMNKINKKYGWTLFPCYNRPLYNLISINNNIYLMPLRGFGNVAFKIKPMYALFYQKCFGDFVNCCILTGFLMDNCGIKTDSNENCIKFELNIIDLLLPQSYMNDKYNYRKKRINYVVSNYEKYKHTVEDNQFFKYIPLKLNICHSQTGQRNIELFKNKIIKNGNVVSSIYKDKLQWNDIHFDMRQCEEAPHGYYFEEIALNSRISTVLWMNNKHRNVLLDGLYFCNI